MEFQIGDRVRYKTREEIEDTPGLEIVDIDGEFLDVDSENIGFDNEYVPDKLVEFLITECPSGNNYRGRIVDKVCVKYGNGLDYRYKDFGWDHYLQGVLITLSEPEEEIVLQNIDVLI